MSRARGPRIAAVITTYDGLDLTRANMEIVRSRWEPHFDEVLLVHAYNGPQAWTRYLEDRLVVVPPSASHFTGAASLIDAGSLAVEAEDPSIRYVVYLANDCWLYRPEQLFGIVEEMAREELRLAAARFEVAEDAHGVSRQRGDPSLLPGAGLTTDFFVLDLPWALETAMMPLDFDGFIATYGPLLDYFQEIVLLEKHLEGRFLGAVRSGLRQARWRKDGLGSEGLRQARGSLRVLHERPIDPQGLTAPRHKGHWPGLGLTTTEHPEIKREELLPVEGLRGGPILERFFSEADLSWFDAGGVR